MLPGFLLGFPARHSAMRLVPKRIRKNWWASRDLGIAGFHGLIYLQALPPSRAQSPGRCRNPAAHTRPHAQGRTHTHTHMRGRRVAAPSRVPSTKYRCIWFRARTVATPSAVGRVDGSRPAVPVTLESMTVATSAVSPCGGKVVIDRYQAPSPVSLYCSKTLACWDSRRKKYGRLNIYFII